MHLLRRPRGLLFVTLAEPLLYPFRGIGGWRKDPYAKNVPLGRLRLFGGPYPTVDSRVVYGSLWYSIRASSQSRSFIIIFNQTFIRTTS